MKLLAVQSLSPSPSPAVSLDLRSPGARASLPWLGGMAEASQPHMYTQTQISTGRDRTAMFKPPHLTNVRLYIYRLAIASYIYCTKLVTLPK